MKILHAKYHGTGFSLLEVLVALLVISISLLGVAGMQAMSIGNTGAAAFRSIAATEGSTLASMMSANEGYWQNLKVGTTTTISNTTVTSSDSALTGSPTCGSSTCTPAQLAMADLQTWGGELKNLLPGGTGQVNCSVAGTSPNNVTTCQIIIYWTEKNAAQNQNSGAAAGSQYDFEMVVLP